ncbi:MAG: DUF4062 domain-containing protein [Acidobacteriota bacterium]
MRTLKAYITCDSQELMPLMETAEAIANQKGCDPIRVGWPWLDRINKRKAENEATDEVRTYRKIAENRIRDCDIFIAIVGERYGDRKVLHPEDGRTDRLVSSMHFELATALRSKSESGHPAIKIFKFSQRLEKPVEDMLIEARLSDSDFHSTKEFSIRFAEWLTEHLQRVKESNLRSLHKYKIHITCRDEVGQLSRLAEVISDMDGNLAGGHQFSSGETAILDFVAEWPESRQPDPINLQIALENAFPAPSSSGQDSKTIARVHEISSESHTEFNSNLTYTVTFFDQPGIARNIFDIMKKDRHSVLAARVDTFVSGGVILGRLLFSFAGDDLTWDLRSKLERNIVKLPGILHVDFTSTYGRFWRKP